MDQPTDLFFGHQLSLCSDVSNHILRQTTDRILIQDSVPPGPTRILLHGLCGPHVGAVDLSQLGVISFSKEVGCISYFVFLLFGRGDVRPEHWEVGVREEVGHDGLSQLFFFSVSLKIQRRCGRTGQRILGFRSTEE